MDSRSDYTYSKSLISFFEEIVRPRLSQNYLNVLDIGSGGHSIFEDVQNFNAAITAIDFARELINNAPTSKIKYLVANVTDPVFFPSSTYDLVFDSHCFNCIVNNQERDKAFKNIFSALKAGGCFASEMMVQPIDRTVSMPMKVIKSSLELEQEILSHGFKIVYFMISRDSYFISERDGVEIKCDLLRIVCLK